MAYRSSKEERDRVRREVLESIAPGSTPLPIRRRRASYRVRGVSLHTRYCRGGKTGFWFNSNPNSLRADFELWICGNSRHWYLIPGEVLRHMYDAPDAYPDHHHAEICVVAVDVGSHIASYARRALPLDLSAYFLGVLP